MINSRYILLNALSVSPSRFPASHHLCHHSLAPIPRPSLHPLPQPPKKPKKKNKKQNKRTAFTFTNLKGNGMNRLNGGKDNLSDQDKSLTRAKIVLYSSITDVQTWTSIPIYQWGFPSTLCWLDKRPYWRHARACVSVCV